MAYFVFAHLALALAFGVAMADPWSLAGFFYHPRMLAVVHLITLGWITCSILGALYLVAPMALAVRWQAGRADAWGCALVLAGIGGMVGHFWIDEASGMAWSAGVLIVGLAIPSLGFLRALGRSRLPTALQLPFWCAFGNLFLAAGLGAVIALDKTIPFLSGHIHHRVFAHAHLAAIGWAMMMVVAVGGRLLPMLLPSAIPRGRWLWLGTLCLEVGVLGVFVGWLLGGDGVAVFSVVTSLGLGVFLSRIGWMLRYRRRRAATRPRHDPGLWQVGLAFVYLVVSVVLGLALVWTPVAPWELAAVMAYGVAALVGFLAQLVVAVAPSLLAWLSWLWATAQDSFRGAAGSPYELPNRPLQLAVVALWAFGVPALGAGLTGDSIRWIHLGAAALLLAVLAQGMQMAWILRHAWPSR